MRNAAREVAIVGVAETPPQRAEPRALGEMVTAAVRAALADAGLRPRDVDGLVTESATMPKAFGPDALLCALGQVASPHPFIACGLPYGTGLVAAPQLAATAIAAGLAEVVVCWYGHKLSEQADGPRTLYAEDPFKAELELPQGWYGQPVYFAALAQRYAHLYGLRPEELAATVLESRAHAARTPGAMRTRPITLDDYLASPVIAEPLRALDCCLVSDGALAFVMTSVERARDLRHPVVRVAGVGTGRAALNGDTWFTQNPDYPATPAAISGPRAFAAAGLRPDDIDFVELYDCFSINTLLQFEDLGFAPRGEGAAFALAKGRELGDRLPTNTHGGLLSHSFMLGGGHIIEAVRQLRWARGAGQVPGCRTGLVTALGVPHHATMILQRAD